MKLFGSFTLFVIVAAALVHESNARYSNPAVDTNIDVQVKAALANNNSQVAAGTRVGAKCQISHKKLVKHKKKTHKVIEKHGKGFVPRKNLTPAQIKQKNQIKSLLVKIPKMKATSRIMQVVQTHNKVARKACTTSSQCSIDQYCSSKLKECRAKIADGKSCSSDAACSNSLCQPKTGLCASANLKNGLKCSKSTQCTSGNCEKARCAAKLANGAVCSKDVNCISSYCSVKSKKCAKKPTITTATTATTATTPVPVNTDTPEQPVLTEQQQLDFMCYSELKAERPAKQIVEETADALSTVIEDVTYTFPWYNTLTVTAGAQVTPRAVRAKRQLSPEAIAILTNPESTPEQIKAVTDQISASYGQDIISQACFELVYDGEYEVTYTTTTPAVETEYNTVATETQWLATVTVAAQV